MRQTTVFKRRGIRSTLRWAVLCTLAPLLFVPAQAEGFDFDTSNNQGWTYRVYNSNGTSDIRSGFATWIDSSSYPTVNDPSGDGRGGIRHPIFAADYSSASSGDYLIVQFESPDLSTRAAWQAAESFSVKLLPTTAAASWTPELFANIGIVVYDRDEERERTFINGTATEIDARKWESQDLDIASTLAAADPPVTDYEIVQVRASFFVAVDGSHYVADPQFFVIDEAVPGVFQVFRNVRAFRDVAGSWIRYGFEVNDLSEDINELPGSPVDAADFDDHFDIAYADLNGFNVYVDPGGDCTLGPARSLYTHSVGTADSYTLTFSNFGGDDSAVTAFGLTVCDFASYLSTAASITFDTGTRSGTLLTVANGQSSYTKNFVGVVVGPEDAFTSITLTFDDNASGTQYLDSVHYSPE